MRASNYIHNKILTLPQLLAEITRLRLKSKTIAFTNGCFDILHEGHIFSLNEAASFADYLIVAVNSDDSVKRLQKGPERPVNNQNSRALIIASLEMVDAVVIFDEDTPYELINAIEPDVLVKGGDYTIETIVGAKEVLSKGGEVKIIPIKQGFSTTGIIDKIRRL